MYIGTYNMTNQGMQLWQVPETTTYTFTLISGAGGSSGEGGSSYCKTGTKVTATAQLQAYSHLLIIVGHGGVFGSSVPSGGGGGLSGIFNYNTTSQTYTPLLVVGGSGGCSIYDYNNSPSTIPASPGGPSSAPGAGGTGTRASGTAGSNSKGGDGGGYNSGFSNGGGGGGGGGDGTLDATFVGGLKPVLPAEGGGVGGFGGGGGAGGAQDGGGGGGGGWVGGKGGDSFNVNAGVGVAGSSGTSYFDSSVTIISSFPGAMYTRSIVNGQIDISFNKCPQGLFFTFQY